MKTVLQMIIDQFKGNEEVEYTGASVVNLLEMYLLNEKQQIIEAYKKGLSQSEINWNPENYYNETFNTK